MGINYGIKRGRGERIATTNPVIRYALGNSQDIKLSEYGDYDEIQPIIQRSIDEANKRLKEL